MKKKLSKQYRIDLLITCRVSTENFTHCQCGLKSNKDQPFALVMGAKGLGRNEAFVPGSFCLAAAKYCTQPLIIVLMGCNYKPVKKMGLACDMGSYVNAFPLSNVSYMVRLLKATLDIVYVRDRDKKMPSKVLTECKTLLNRLTELHPAIRLVADEALLHFSNEAGIGLLIIVPRKRSLIERMLYGSLSKNGIIS